MDPDSVARHNATLRSVLDSKTTHMPRAFSKGILVDRNEEEEELNQWFIYLPPELYSLLRPVSNNYVFIELVNLKNV